MMSGPGPGKDGDRATRKEGSWGGRREGAAAKILFSCKCCC